MSSTIIDGTCSMDAEEKKASYGHNAKMPALQRNIEQSRSQDYSANNDPLEQIDKIELVQQSDSTVHLIGDEEVSTDNNLSCISLAPIQNLLGVFENMDNKSKTSPNGVEQYNEKSPNGRDEESKRNNEDEANGKDLYQNQIKLELLEFNLHETLRLNLTQPVINRCSLYSIIHGVNKAVNDMAAEDINGNIEETKDEDSALVRAVNGPSKSTSKREGPHTELAVLDEEKFLLAAISSRSADEMRIRACPATFAEAIGEVDASVVSDPTYASSNSQSENPLSELSSSRTQLWKPSRSWWEAKSGKNPWIEPKHHNKRWRYLWPLIHYHKFLAKCIKKLKRNHVDVKKSYSPVAAFLREEVCAVSDHLAAASKFTSEEWMEGLPHFNGWIAQDEESQKRLSEIVHILPMRSLSEPDDCDSALLRSQIDQCYLIAFKNQREQMENGGQERNYEESVEDFKNKRTQGISNQSFVSSTNGSRPPRHGGSRGPRHNRMPHNQRFANGHHRQYRNQYGQRMYGGYPPQDHSMMIPPHMHHGMYPPHFNQSFHGGYVPGQHYMQPSMNTSMLGWVNNYGGNDYSNLNISVSAEWEQYNSNHFDPSMDYGHCDESIANTSVTSLNHFEPSHHHFPPVPPVQTIDQRQVSNGTNNTNNEAISNTESGSFEDGTLNVPEQVANTMQTPAKEASKKSNASIQGTPASPSWAHLHTVPGLATPLAHHGAPSGPHVADGAENHQSSGVEHNPGMRPNSNWVNPKSLFINPNYNNHHFPQGGLVPPSPATQFTMSPQANSQSAAYFHGYHPRQNAAMHPQVHNGAPPMQQTYLENGNQTSLNNVRTLSEETSSVTTSEVDQNQG